MATDLTQDYLKPAPLGVDALYAWTFRGGHGEGIGFVDVEAGWDLQHEDLVYLGLKAPIFGINPKKQWSHGTSALGVVAGKAQNDHSGLATDLRFVGLSSIRQADGSLNISGAISAGAGALRAGDVLLVEEASGDGGPIEEDSRVLAAIQGAVKAGIVVVEAAGNGGRSLSRGESGAILVGAVEPSAQDDRHEVLSTSNYGTAVDCYAWGEGISAPGSIVMFLSTALPEAQADVVPAEEIAGPYYGSFTDTSAASAIIAGVVALIQGIAQSHGLPVISSSAMRSLLRTAELGTPVYRKGDYQGPMPDLKRILDNLGVTPP